MVWTSGTWRVKAGREDEFVGAWGEFARWSQAAFAGGHAWLLRDRADPRVFLSIGPWPDDEVIERWRSSEGFRDRIGRIRDLLESFEPRTLEEVIVVE